MKKTDFREFVKTFTVLTLEYSKEKSFALITHNKNINMPNITIKKVFETETTMTLQVEVQKNTIPLLYQEEVSPVEFYKRQLDIILKNTPNITVTKLYLLAYIKVYGQEYKKYVLEDRICTTLDSINNYESELRRMKLLQFYWPDAQINP